MSFLSCSLVHVFEPNAATMTSLQAELKPGSEIGECQLLLLCYSGCSAFRSSFIARALMMHYVCVSPLHVMCCTIVGPTVFGDKYIAKVFVNQCDLFLMILVVHLDVTTPYAISAQLVSVHAVPPGRRRRCAAPSRGPRRQGSCPRCRRREGRVSWPCDAGCSQPSCPSSG